MKRYVKYVNVDLTPVLLFVGRVACFFIINIYVLYQLYVNSLLNSLLSTNVGRVACFLFTRIEKVQKFIINNKPFNLLELQT